MGHLINQIKPGMVLVSITPPKEKKQEIYLDSQTKKELEAQKMADGSHPVEKVLMIGDQFQGDAIRVEVGDRVIVSPYASVIRVRQADGSVAGLVPGYDILCIVGG
jgi:co-chaperonin GroES (HSP10)